VRISSRGRRRGAARRGDSRIKADDSLFWETRARALAPARPRARARARPYGSPHRDAARRDVRFSVTDLPRVEPRVARDRTILAYLPAARLPAPEPRARCLRSVCSGVPLATMSG